MEKERIDLFGEEPKKLTDGRRSAISRVSRSSAAFFSTIALGVAMFAVIFMICCFAGGLGSAGIWQPGQVADESSDTINDTVSTPPDTQAGGVDVETDTVVADVGKNKSFLDFLRSLINYLGGNSAAETTDTAGKDVAEDETLPVYVNTDDLYYFDYSKVPPGGSPIVPMDMSLVSYGETYICNETSYTPKVSALLNSKDAIPAFDFLNAAVYPVGKPVVLIIHTHGTEAYSKEGSISYTEDDGELARSADTTQNVVESARLLPRCSMRTG